MGKDSKCNNNMAPVKKKLPKKSESEHSFAQKYKLSLTDQQKQTLVSWGGSIRLISNAAKEERELRYQQNKNRPESLREYINSLSQLYSLPEIKSTPGFEFIGEVPSQALQQALMDLDKSFQTFFKNGRGYPRWKTRTKDGVKLRFPNGAGARISRLKDRKSVV